MKVVTNKTLKVLGLAGVALALTAPAALAGSTAGLDSWAANAVRDSGRYGGLDSWAYNAIHAGPANVITEHSAGQHPVVRLATPVTIAATADTHQFSFRDAGIGAAVAFAAMVVALASFVARRRVLQPSA
jgi:hypothetical protein